MRNAPNKSSRLRAFVARMSDLYEGRCVELGAEESREHGASLNQLRLI